PIGTAYILVTVSPDVRDVSRVCLFDGRAACGTRSWRNPARSEVISRWTLCVWEMTRLAAGRNWTILPGPPTSSQLNGAMVAGITLISESKSSDEPPPAFAASVFDGISTKSVTG